jgi:hypothetical protein
MASSPLSLAFCSGRAFRARARCGASIRFFNRDPDRRDLRALYRGITEKKVAGVDVKQSFLAVVILSRLLENIRYLP